MMKNLNIFGAAILAIGATLTTPGAHATGATNVVENVSINLTVYQQGTTNSKGTVITDKIISFKTKDLIAALGAVTGTNYPANSKLVYSTIYSNVFQTNRFPVVTNLSTNVPSPVPAGTNIITDTLGGFDVSSHGLGTNTTVKLTNYGLFEILIGTNPPLYSTSNSLIVASNGTVIESQALNSNMGFLTTITAETSPGSNGVVTNYAIETTSGTPTNVFKKVGSFFQIMHGPANAPLFDDMSPYLSRQSLSSAIEEATGRGLKDRGRHLTFSNYTSETDFRIENWNIGYFMTNGPTNLKLNLNGFFQGSLKIDPLFPHTADTRIENIKDANSSGTVQGYGFWRGSFLTNLPTGCAFLLPSYQYVGTNYTYITGSITNPFPIVVKGTIQRSFLLNVSGLSF